MDPGNALQWDRKHRCCCHGLGLFYLLGKPFCGNARASCRAQFFFLENRFPQLRVHLPGLASSLRKSWMLRDFWQAFPRWAVRSQAADAAAASSFFRVDEFRESLESKVIRSEVL